MKILTTNFITCAVKACKSSPLSYPLHFKDATLERTAIDFNPVFMANILPRINWAALKTTATELGLGGLVSDDNPSEDPGWNGGGGEDGEKVDGTRTVRDAGPGDREATLRKLHGLLLETGVAEGKLVCGHCGFEYPIKEGVGNFLLPAHLV